jgi:hypothetical protein
MKYLLPFALLGMLAGCHPSPYYPYFSFHEYPEYKYTPPPPVQPIENHTGYQLLSTWEPASAKFDLLGQFQSPSDRFAMAMGYARASGSDVVSTWSAVSGSKDGLLKGKLALQDLRNLFEDSNIEWIFPIKDADFLQMAQILNTMLSLSPSLFAQNMFEVDVKFEVHPENSAKRDLNKLKSSLHKALDQSTDQQQACYWLGVMVAEREKDSLPTENYWQICDLGTTTRQEFLDFLAVEGLD